MRTFPCTVAAIGLSLACGHRGAAVATPAATAAEVSAPPPSKATATDVTTEILVRRGHGHDVNAVVGGPGWLVTSSLQDVSAWAVSEDGKAEVKRSFVNATRHSPLGRADRPSYVAVYRPGRTELFRPGAWGTPVLGVAQGVHDATTLRSVFPEREGGRYGVAVRDVRGWTVFDARDDAVFERAQLPGVVGPFSDLARISLQEVAVKLGNADGAGAGTWRAFRCGDAAWTAIELLSGGVAPSAVQVISEGFLLRVDASPGVEPRTRWLVREGGIWKDVATQLGLAPEHITRVDAPAGERALLVRGDAVASPIPYAWTLFLRSSGAWRAHPQVVPGTNGVVDAWEPFAGNRGLSIRTFTVDAEGPLSARWHHLIADGAGEWRRLEDQLSVPAGSIRRTWVTGDHVVGVEVLEPSGTLASRWFVELEGAWRPLGAIVPRPPADAADVTLDSGALISLETRGGGDARERRHFLREGGGFVDATTVLPDARDATSVELFAGGAFALAESKGGRKRWYARTPAGWRDLTATVEGARSEPSPAAVTVPLSVTVRSSRGRDIAVVTTRAEDGRGPDKFLVRAANAPQWVEAACARPSPETRRWRLQGELFAADRTAGAGLELAVLDGMRCAPVPEVIPGAPARVRAGFAFLGDRGLAVQEEGDANGDGRFDAWSYWVRDAQGRWRDVEPLLSPRGRRLRMLYSVGTTNGLAVEWIPSSPDERSWSYYLRGADGSWREVQSLLGSSAGPVWDATLFARDLGVAVRTRPSDRKPTAFFLRDEADRLVPLASVLPIAHPNQVVDFWEGAGIAVRAGAPDGHWSLFERPSGTWRPITFGVPLTGEPRAIRGVERWRFLAVLAVSPGGGPTWTAVIVDAGGNARPLGDVTPGVPSGIDDVAVFPESAKLAIRDRTTRRWRWWQVTDGRFERLTDSDEPTWVAGAWRRLPDGGVALDGAQHVVNGVATSGVPAPEAWLARSPATAGASVLVAPELVPETVEAVGGGSGGTTLVYRVAGRTVVAAFTSGAVEIEKRTLTGRDGSTMTEPFVLVRYASGLTHIHRLADPTRWISLYEDPVLRARIYFDDRGFFFSERGALEEILAFRNGNETFSFRQLGAYLFRPDLLEERLGLEPESFFPLTETDREAIATARRLLARGVQLAMLRPPTLRLGAVNTEASEPRITIPYEIRPGASREVRVTMRILTAGQARGDDPSLRRFVLGPTQDAIAGSGEVPLLEGDNTIEVSATDGAELTAVQRVSVHYTPRAKVRHDLWVAIVAASRYMSSGFQPLPMARNDVAVVRAIALAQKDVQYSDVHTESWCDATTAAAPGPACDHGASRHEILTGLRAMLSRMSPGDTALLFISGHGIRYQQRYFFAPADADRSESGTWIGWNELRALLAGTGIPGRKLIVLDTCHAGAIAGERREQERIVQQAAEFDGLYMLVASAPDASAWEIKDLGTGIFTDALRSGLSGEADFAPSDGKVAFQELALYLGEKVRKVAARYGVSQQPYYPLIDDALDFVIAQPPRLSRTSVSVQATTSELNEPGTYARWLRELRDRVPGFVPVGPGEGELRLDIVERRGGRVKVTLRRGASVLLSREAKPTEVAPAVAARLDSLYRELAQQAPVGRSTTAPAVAPAR